MEGVFILDSKKKLKLIAGIAFLIGVIIFYIFEFFRRIPSMKVTAVSIILYALFGICYVIASNREEKKRIKKVKKLITNLN